MPKRAQREKRSRGKRLSLDKLYLSYIGDHEIVNKTQALLIEISPSLSLDGVNVSLINNPYIGGLSPYVNIAGIVKIIHDVTGNIPKYGTTIADISQANALLFSSDLNKFNYGKNVTLAYASVMHKNSEVSAYIVYPEDAASYFNEQTDNGIPFVRFSRYATRNVLRKLLSMVDPLLYRKIIILENFLAAKGVQSLQIDLLDDIVISEPSEDIKTSRDIGR